MAVLPGSEGGEPSGGGQAGGGGPSQRITPYMSRLQPKHAATPPSASVQFRARAQAGETVAVLGPAAATPAAAGEAMEVEGAEGSCVELEVLGRPMPANARFMVDRPEDKVRPRLLAWGRCCCPAAWAVDSCPSLPLPRALLPHASLMELT